MSFSRHPNVLIDSIFITRIAFCRTREMVTHSSFSEQSLPSLLSEAYLMRDEAGALVPHAEGDRAARRPLDEPVAAVWQRRGREVVLVMVHRARRAGTRRSLAPVALRRRTRRLDEHFVLPQLAAHAAPRVPRRRLLRRCCQ